MLGGASNYNQALPYKEEVRLKQTHTPRRKSSQPKLQLCYTDTGGTFTDTFLVDEDGGFFIGKASTTPDDLSVGYFNSVEATLKKADLRAGLFSGVNMQRADLSGANVGRDDLGDATDLRELDLRGAVLHDVDLTSAILNWTRECLGGARYSRGTRFPEGGRPEECGMILDE